MHADSSVACQKSNMARIHARRRGVSGSTKPKSTSSKDWVSYSKEEVEELVLKLAKEGSSPSKIGLLLRDQYGIPDVVELTGMKINKILESKGVGLSVPEDLQSLINKAVALDNHLQKHIKDKHNRRALMLVESKIRRLSKYYIACKRLPSDWRYDMDKARLLVSK
jgi:small subunit ribosomal protein S15